MTADGRRVQQMYLIFLDEQLDRVELAAGRFQEENQDFQTLDFLNRMKEIPFVMHMFKWQLFMYGKEHVPLPGK